MPSNLDRADTTYVGVFRGLGASVPRLHMCLARGEPPFPGTTNLRCISAVAPPHRASANARALAEPWTFARPQAASRADHVPASQRPSPELAPYIAQSAFAVDRADA